jgi:hypothetical protein
LWVASAYDQPLTVVCIEARRLDAPAAPVRVSVSRNRSRASHRPRCSIQAGSGYHNGTLTDHGANVCDQGCIVVRGDCPTASPPMGIGPPVVKA